MKRKRLPFVMMIGCAALAFTGCSGSGSGNAPGAATTAPPKEQAKPAEPAKPVTLKLFPNQAITDDDFKKLIADPVKKKYPYITVEMIARPKDKFLQDFVAAGDQMDLVTMWDGSLTTFKELKLYEDITPLAKKHNFDLGRFEQGALDAIKTASDKGELYALPYGVQFNALYYNKDIFDKFGVPYPKDGMTWDQTYELATKLTRLENGVQYRGFDPETWVRVAFPLSLNLIDLKTQKSVVTTEPYKRVFELSAKLYNIPGNKPANMSQNATDMFIKEKNVAMLGSVNQFDRLKGDLGFQWDVVQYPSYADKPNVFGLFDMHTIFIPSTSKNKDDAMKVLEVLFSDEVQMMSTKETGRLVALKNPEFNKNFGADMPHLKGKNIQGIFKSKPAPSPGFSEYFAKARTIATNSFYEYLDGKKDVNTALREADEKINQMVETEKKK